MPTRLALLAVLFAAAPAAGQTPGDATVYLEAMGNAGWGSLNAEVPVGGALLRVGLASEDLVSVLSPADDWHAGDRSSIDLSLVATLGRAVSLGGGHALEVAAGGVLGTAPHPWARSPHAQPALTGTLGYRHASGDWLLRAGLTPVYVSERLVLTGGLSVGVPMTRVAGWFD